jgi:hypothetical protein
VSQADVLDVTGRTRTTRRVLELRAIEAIRAVDRGEIRALLADAAGRRVRPRSRRGGASSCPTPSRLALGVRLKERRNLGRDPVVASVKMIVNRETVD